ncbi:MAG: hypothetical protein QF441_09735 [Bacteriovoracaceae bacterium]|jgi:hypothetical protein|nr:hypothetical protein [Bacteriovoracaceae bacterium]
MRLILGFLAVVSLFTLDMSPKLQQRVLLILKQEVAIKIDKGLKRKMAPYSRKLTGNHSSFLFEKHSK